MNIGFINYDFVSSNISILLNASLILMIIPGSDEIDLNVSKNCP
jgi:hypothetical protein